MNAKLLIKKKPQNLIRLNDLRKIKTRSSNFTNQNR
jgi:hypothetical protein